MQKNKRGPAAVKNADLEKQREIKKREEARDKEVRDNWRKGNAMMYKLLNAEEEADNEK